MTEKPTPLWDIARLFLKLGSTAFGGPTAHIAMLQREVVERRGWLSEAEFLDHLGASNLIPGPTSTELVIHVGRRRGGWPGLLVAGCGAQKLRRPIFRGSNACPDHKSLSVRPEPNPFSSSQRCRCTSYRYEARISSPIS